MESLPEPERRQPRKIVAVVIIILLFVTLIAVILYSMSPENSSPYNYHLAKINELIVNETGFAFNDIFTIPMSGILVTWYQLNGYTYVPVGQGNATITAFPHNQGSIYLAIFPPAGYYVDAYDTLNENPYWNPSYNLTDVDHSGIFRDLFSLNLDKLSVLNGRASIAFYPVVLPYADPITDYCNCNESGNVTLPTIENSIFKFYLSNNDSGIEITNMQISYNVSSGINLVSAYDPANLGHTPNTLNNFLCYINSLNYTNCTYSLGPNQFVATGTNLPNLFAIQVTTELNTTVPIQMNFGMTYEKPDGTQDFLNYTSFFNAENETT